MADRSVGIRVGVKGGSDVKSTFADIARSGETAFDGVGAAGEAAAKRAAKSFGDAQDEITRQIAKQNRATALIQAITPQTPMQARVNQSVGTNFANDYEGSAKRSAAAFRELVAAQDAMSARAAAIRDVLNPAIAVQARYTAEVRATRDVWKAGAITSEEYTARLRQLLSAQQQIQGSMGRVNGAAGAQRAGLQQLGFQIGDFTTQVSSGTSIAQAFAQQIGQTGQAIQLMYGNTSKLGAFLGGGWGIALTVAMTALAPFVAKMFEESEASKAAREALDAHRQAVFALAAAQEKALLTSDQQARATAIEAENHRLATIRVRERLAAELALLQTRLKDEDRRANDPSLAGEGGFNPGAAAGGAVASRLQFVQDALAQNQKNIDLLTRGSSAALNLYIAGRADKMRTPEGQVGLKYDEKIAAAKSRGDFIAYDRLSRARDAEIKAIGEANKALRASTTERERAAKAETATPANITKMLREAIPGVQITSTTGGKHVPGSYHYKGQAVDFVPKGGMGSMTKEDVRRIFAAKGVNIVELLGPGDKGHSDHFHVAWTKGKLALDNFTAAAKTASDEKRDLMQLLGLFDPAAEDAAKYADQLARIAKLLASGAITDSQKGIMSRAATLANFDAQAAPPPNADAVLKSVGIDPDAPLILPGLAQTEARAEAIRQSIVPIIDAMDVLKQHGADAIDAITDPRNWNDMGSLAKSIIQSILSDLIMLAVANPLKNLLGMKQSDGSPFSVLGGLGGLFGGKGKGIVAGDNILLGGGMPKFKFAAGTSYAYPGMALVGEEGPELVRMQGGERVFNNRQTTAMMRQGGGGMALTYAPVFNAPNADSAGMAQLRAMVEEDRRQMPARTLELVANARQRRIID